MKEDNWFTFNREGRIIEVDLNREKGLDDYCYFCDFSEIKPHKHHIIRKSDGGTDAPTNKIPLCPNHHSLIHKGTYILGFSRGYYFLKHKKTKKIIPPHKRQKVRKKRLPLTSIKKSKLIIEGDLSTKAILKIPKIGVQSEKCAK